MTTPSSARKKRRPAPLHGSSPGPVHVVRPGLPAGLFHPLSNADAQAIIDAALEVLERVGLAGLASPLEEKLLAAGASLGADRRLRFPRALLARVLRDASNTVTLRGRLPEKDLQIGGHKVHTGLGGAAVEVLDGVTGRHRSATLDDLWSLSRVADACEHIHYVIRPVVARDMPDERTLDLNTAYACLAATTKPIGVSFSEARVVDEAVELFDIALGGAGAFGARPCCFGVVCHVVPPLRFAPEACATLERMIELGMPVQICSAGQAGATSPAALAGTLVQGLAESLGGLALVNLLSPGHPCVLAFMPFVSDLRTGALASGSGEGAIASAAAAQLLGHLGLASTTCAGMTDAKLPDAQAGYEKAYSVALAAHAGANMINLSASMLASLIAASAETMIIDNEMLGAVLRTVRGIEVNPGTLSVDVIEEVVAGDGHYLGHRQTRELMKRDFLYPRLGDRRSLDEWREQGSPTLWQRAHEIVETILRSPPAEPIPPERDAEIRRRFPIHLKTR